MSSRKLPRRPVKAAPRRTRLALGPPPRHDTPVDRPQAIVIGDPAGAASAALSRAGSLETLSAGFAAWADLRRERAEFVAAQDEERQRLGDEAEFLLGAAKAARGLSGPKARAALGRDGAVEEARQKIAAARRALEARLKKGESRFAAARETLLRTLEERIDRRLASVPPALALAVRVLAGDRRILHVGKVGADDAVALLRVLTGALPSRHEFLADDSTDDLGQAPATLFAEEGVEAQSVRPSPKELAALLGKKPQVLPVKGELPFLLPGAKGAARLVRLLQRGPVLELELAEGQGFRGVLSRDEAEAAAGYLLKLKVERRLQVSITTGAS